MLKTSLSHPLRIDEVRVDGIAGAIGLTFCPGKVQSGALTGEWQRDLTADLEVVKHWGAAAMVNLLEPHELVELGVPGHEDAVRAVLGADLDYVRAPIHDVSTPSAAFEELWRAEHGARLREILRAGRNVLVFCKGGLGRTGTIAARLLVELGCGPMDAIARVRAARAGAIETHEQAEHVVAVGAAPEPASRTPALVDRVAGGLVGLLVGDALGVPYEFKSPERLPARECIDMIPPLEFRRSHAGVPPGTWSDDGAQALCLLESLLDRDALDLDDFADRLVRWLDRGHLAVDANVFDVGVSTATAIDRLRSGAPADTSGGISEQDNGNGSLMRVLPLALWHRGTDDELVELAHRQSLPTHAHPRSQVVCAFYCLIARALLVGRDDAVAWAENRLRTIYGALGGDYARELDTVCSLECRNAPQGTGYVVDCFWSAIRCLEEPTYDDVIRSAIALGNDTDTTACVAGGLAGIRFGLDAIPARWREALRGRELLEPLLRRLMAVVAT